jgi:hypothetical protein
VFSISKGLTDYGRATISASSIDQLIPANGKRHQTCFGKVCPCHHEKAFLTWYSTLVAKLWSALELRQG